MALNPYLAGPAVGGRRSFVGRKDIIRDAIHILDRPENRALVLYGQRRIGKTSILQQLDGELRRTKTWIPVYTDMQEYAGDAPPPLFSDLAARIARALGIEEPTNVGTSADRFQAWLTATTHQLPSEMGILLLFDEFDVLAAPASADKDARPSLLFPDLRRILETTQERLSCFFVIGRNINDLSSVALSLFKGTEARLVSLLSENDTRELIRLSEVDGGLRWAESALRAVWSLTNGHPFLTQILCSKVWEATSDAKKSVAEAEDVNLALPATIDASRNSLQWLWEGLGPAPRVVASALAGLGAGAFPITAINDALLRSGVAVLIGEINQAPRVLREWDLIELQGESCRFRVELLRRWIVENKPLMETQDELDRVEPEAELLYKLAAGRYKQGKVEEAKSALEQSLSLNRGHARASELYADLLLRDGDVDHAVEILERLFSSRPDSARPRLVRALLAQADRRANEAEKVLIYDRILKELAPRQPEALLRLEQIHRRRAEEAERRGDLQAALRFLEAAGLSEEAERIRVTIESKAIQEEEDRLRQMIGVGEFDAVSARLELAVTMWGERFPIRELDTLLSHQIEVVDWFNRGEVAKGAGNVELAIHCFAQVLIRNPDHTLAIDHLCGSRTLRSDTAETHFDAERRHGVGSVRIPSHLGGDSDASKGRSIPALVPPLRRWVMVGLGSFLMLAILFACVNWLFNPFSAPAVVAFGQSNPWVVVRPPARSIRLGLPTEMPDYTVPGFRPSANVRSPSYSFEILKHKVCWGDLRSLGKDVDFGNGLQLMRSGKESSEPVSGLTWGSASKICSAIGARLPTEEEWEYAARLLPSEHGTTPDMTRAGCEWTTDLWRQDFPGQDEVWVTAHDSSYRALRGACGPFAQVQEIVGVAWRDTLCTGGTCAKQVGPADLREVGFRCVRMATDLQQ